MNVFSIFFCKWLPWLLLYLHILFSDQYLMLSNVHRSDAKVHQTVRLDFLLEPNPKLNERETVN